MADGEQCQQVEEESPSPPEKPLQPLLADNLSILLSNRAAELFRFAVATRFSLDSIVCESNFGSREGDVQRDCFEGLRKGIDMMRAYLIELFSIIEILKDESFRQAIWQDIQSNGAGRLHQSLRLEIAKKVAEQLLLIPRGLGDPSMTELELICRTTRSISEFLEDPLLTYPISHIKKFEQELRLPACLT